MTILDEISEYARKRVLLDKEKISFEDMKENALKLGKGSGELFENALKKEGLSVISEVKKASPSKGIIAEDFD